MQRQATSKVTLTNQDKSISELIILVFLDGIQKIKLA